MLPTTRALYRPQSQHSRCPPYNRPTRPRWLLSAHTAHADARPGPTLRVILQLPFLPHLQPYKPWSCSCIYTGCPASSSPVEPHLPDTTQLRTALVGQGQAGAHNQVLGYLPPKPHFLGGLAKAP
jgi:hypothetical protein